MSAIGPMGSSVGDIIAMRQQLVERSSLLKELRQAGTAGAADVATPGAPAQGGDFAGSLKSALDQVSGAQSRAEELSTGYERGEVTDVASVMLARQEAGVAFEATLQVRNKLLSAYQEIMRMGI